jgi:hypothetical protein
VLALAPWAVKQQIRWFLLVFFDLQGVKASKKLVAANCIFSCWLENSSDCNKLYTCLGPLGSEATNKVVSACLFDTQGAKVRTKLIAATCIFSWWLKNSIATTSFRLALAPWVSSP